MLVDRPDSLHYYSSVPGGMGYRDQISYSMNRNARRRPIVVQNLGINSEDDHGIWTLIGSEVFFKSTRSVFVISSHELTPDIFTAAGTGFSCTPKIRCWR